MNEEQFTRIKQSPRQASTTDVEGLCDEIERLIAALRLSAGALSMVSPCTAPECKTEQLEWLQAARQAAESALTPNVWHERVRSMEWLGGRWRNEMTDEQIDALAVAVDEANPAATPVELMRCIARAFHAAGMASKCADAIVTPNTLTGETNG